MKSGDADWLIGCEDVKINPVIPYSDLAIRFLDDLSGELRKKASQSGLSDLMSLAFWCRKGNILKLKEEAAYLNNSLGRGLIFHITPSNVPVNFAFSWFFGLLAGNANIVRAPSKNFPQVQMIIDAISDLFEREEYCSIKEATAFIRYGHKKEITDRLSAKANGRIVWGGDETIHAIRQSPISPKCVEIVFADRYSIGMISSEAVLEASDEMCQRLARGFYNDTFLMDQNACSTPHLILWRGKETDRAMEKFWEAVLSEAKRYDLEPIKAVDKYTDFCMAGMSGKLNIRKTKRWGNFLYTVQLNELPKDICVLRGRYGMFYQYCPENIQAIAPYVSDRVQTLLYYGVDKQELLDFVKQEHLLGIDRIVPFGSSLDMNPYWDGYDIIGQLSRRIIGG